MATNMEPDIKRKGRTKKWRKTLLITCITLLTLFVVLPGIGVAIVKWGILPPEKLTPLVINQVNPMLNGQVKVERIELTFWNTFPKVGLRLINGEVISHALKDSVEISANVPHISDSLLRFSNAMVSVDILDYFKRNRVTIERLSIEDPFFYGFVEKDGRANWDILLPSEQEEVADSTQASLPLIDLQRLRIKNGHFIYEDCVADTYAVTTGFNLRMKNVLSKGKLSIDMKTGFQSLMFDSPAYTLDNEVALRFESQIDLSRGKVAFSGAKLLLNDLPFSTDGEVERDGDDLRVDVVFDMEAENIADLISYVPDEYLQDRKKIRTQGSVSVKGHITGLIGDSLQPDLRLSCLINNAALKMKGSDYGIDKLDTDIDIYYNGSHPDSSYMAFKKLDVMAMNTSFSASGRIDKMMTAPYVDTKVKGRIDFTGMLQDILNPDSMIIRGKMDADVEASFMVDDILQGDFSRLRAAGKFEMDRVFVADKIAGLSVYMNGLRFTADTTRQQSSFLTNDDLITAYLTVDTIAVRYKKEIDTKINKLEMSLKTSRNFDPDQVVPMTTHVKMDRLRARLPDSVWVIGRNIYLRGGTKASQTDKKKAVFGGTVSLDTLRYFDVPNKTRMTMESSNFSLEMMPLRDAMRQRRQAAALSGETSTPRSFANAGQQATATDDSARAILSADGQGERSRRRSDTTSQRNREQVSARSAQAEQSQSTGLFRNWEVRGSVKFNRMRLFTGLFPLPMAMDNTTLRFDTDKITLTNAKLKAGKSDFLLNGEVNNIRRAMLRDEVFKANLSLVSEYVDCNQLMRAINRSILFAEEKASPAVSGSTEYTESGEEDAETVVENWEAASEIVAEELPEDEALFVVPKNIDLVLRTKAQKVDFNDLQLNDINGQVIVRNQSVNLRRLRMNSNIGSGNVTMVYTAKDRQKANAGFELEMNDIIVEKLIGMFPSIDTLLPMLRSFEGVLDCQMSGTCEIDSMMNVLLPSLHSACYLTGENMVLMDGETFAEISKTLMFKNKERNLIDYISVDLSIKDNKIEVFPFMVELDRYKLAVGGTHNLDMTFDYHISVIKSPVPFKLGIDVKGDLDDFKYKIVKCRYKNLFTPTREQELEETRLDLRAAIRETIRKQLSENAPELAAGFANERVRSRRPEPVVLDPDSEDEAEITQVQLEGNEAADGGDSDSVDPIPGIEESEQSVMGPVVGQEGVSIGGSAEPEEPQPDSGKRGGRRRN